MSQQQQDWHQKKTLYDDDDFAQSLKGANSASRRAREVPNIARIGVLKGLILEVGARRTPELLVIVYLQHKLFTYFTNY